MGGKESKLKSDVYVGSIFHVALQVIFLMIQSELSKLSAFLALHFQLVSIECIS